MTQYTLEDVQSKVSAIIDAAGSDFVYKHRKNPNGSTGCYYAYNGMPDCIVGRLLAELGVPVADMEEEGVETLERVFSDYIAKLYSVLSDQYDLDFTFEARHFLDELQFRQDQGDTWGEALVAAVNFATSS